MNPTFQNRHTGEFFKWRWENKTHVGLVSLTDQREVKVKRTNFVKSYARADDYRAVPDPLTHAATRHPVPPAPDPPEPIGKPLPPLPLAEARLPGPRVAPRPITTAVNWHDLPSKTWTSSGNDRATQGATSVVRDGTGGDPEPLSRRSKTLSARDRADLRWYAVALVLAALFVVGIWIAVLS